MTAAAGLLQIIVRTPPRHRPPFVLPWTPLVIGVGLNVIASAAVFRGAAPWWGWLLTNVVAFLAAVGFILIVDLITRRRRADDFYVADEPIEKIQQVRRRPPDFVTGPPRS